MNFRHLYYIYIYVYVLSVRHATRFMTDPVQRPTRKVTWNHLEPVQENDAATDEKLASEFRNEITNYCYNSFFIFLLIL